ncbi:MAG: DUF1176 domain-containing protein [Pseudomonadota bacterium]
MPKNEKRSDMRSLFLAVLTLSLSTIAFAEPYGGADGIQENAFGWWINCEAEPDRTCRIDANYALSEEAQMIIIFERSGEPDAPLTLAFYPIPKPEIGGKVRLRVPDEDYGMFGTIKHIPDNGEIRFSGITLDDNLVSAITSGEELQVSVQYFGENDEELTFDGSLHGLTEMLILMDNHQGRIGREDAVVARGGRAANSGDFRLSAIRIEPLEGDDGSEYADQSNTFSQEADEGFSQSSFDQSNAEPAGPVLSEGRVPLQEGNPYPPAWLSDAVLNANVADAGCPIGDSAGDILKYSVSPFMSMYEIPCFLAAYNGSSIYVLEAEIDGQTYASTMSFALPPQRGGSDEFEISNASFDTSTSRLTSFHKGRGIGDCGVYSIYDLVYAEGDTVEFQLVEYREKEDCDGIATPFEQYPLVWSR